mgnify:CR=1 FL=1
MTQNNQPPYILCLIPPLFCLFMALIIISVRFREISESLKFIAEAHNEQHSIVSRH